LTISNAGKTKDKHPFHMMKPRRPYLLTMLFLCAVCILVAWLIGNWHSLNGERADSTEKAIDLNSNHGSGRFVANPDSQENPDRKVASYVLHAIGMPDRAKFRPCNGEHTTTVVAAGNEVVKDGIVVLDRGCRIHHVHESPDETKFHIYVAEFGNEIYQITGRESKIIETSPAINDGAGPWYWLGNDKMIGQMNVYLDPVPEGYKEEGWVIGKKLFVYDLTTKDSKAVKTPPLPLRSNSYLCLDGISDDGLIKLKSLVAWAAEGKEPRDEGWFQLSAK